MPPNLLLKVLACLVFFLAIGKTQLMRKFTIGAIFERGGDAKHVLAFRHAVQRVNQNRQILPGVQLAAEVMHINEDDTFSAERKVCHQLERGVVAILGPLSMSSSEHVRMITDSMEIPYIETRWNYRPRNVLDRGGEYTLNLHPDITSLSGAYLDLLEAYRWTTVTILYQDNDSMMTLKEIFRRTTTAGPIGKMQVVVKRLVTNENGYRDVLREIFQSESKLIVVDCEKKILLEVLRQCQQVGLVSAGYSFFLSSLDAHAVDLEDFKYGGTNFSAYRLIDTERPEVSNIVFEIVQGMTNEDPGLSGIADGSLDTSSALIYDSVTTFALALDQLDKGQRVEQKTLDCYGEEAWPHGNSLVNYMKLVEFVGLSGKIQFDASGLRTQFGLDLMELQPEGLKKIGTWNSLDKLNNLARDTEVEGGVASGNAMSNNTFVITTILTPPYTMLVENTKKLEGNARFEGFAIDLAAELAKKLNCNFTIKLVNPKGRGSRYGEELSPGVWSGMLGEVMDGTADLCIADMSITTKRASAFTFSMPWMNLGIGILYITPRSAAPSLLAFLDPFTADVYIYSCFLFVFVTMVIYVLARFSPNQWEEPPACVKDPEEYENAYTFLNSFWFTLGALMQQGSDVAPLALCVRFAGGIWFFFALIMIASYTANLAAFLTVETLVEPIKSVEDLVGQEEIWYGCGKGGSTSKFFANSDNEVIQKLNVFMTGVHSDEVLVDGNDAGVEKVEEMDGKYAFFMESSSIDYIVERRCNLTKVGSPLDSKGYGIATKQGSPYKPLLDASILQLQEDGSLHRLKTKWWKQKRGGGACAGKRGGGGVKPLGLGNVKGVFLVTVVGCAIAAVFAVLEFLYGTKLSGGDAGVSWVEEMISDLRFIMLCHGNTMNTREVRARALSLKPEPSIHEGERNCNGKPSAHHHHQEVEPLYEATSIKSPPDFKPLVSSVSSDSTEIFHSVPRSCSKVDLVIL